MTPYANPTTEVSIRFAGLFARIGVLEGARLFCCCCVGSDRVAGVRGVQALFFFFDLVRDDGRPCLR